MAKRKLNWGETPWDDLSREELLREVQKLYSALDAARSVMTIVSKSNPSGFWRGTGSGRLAIEKCAQAQERARMFDSESVYRSFFRYADDLLFEGMGCDWVVCDRCEGMWSNIAPEGKDLVGEPCRNCDRKGIDSPLRKITWDDLKPKERTDA